MKKKKRFISGASCPKCRVMDRLFIYSDTRYQFYECFSCGYKEKISKDDQNQSKRIAVTHIHDR